MTTTVLTATSTRTARREPLKVIDMAASQGRPASSSSVRGNGEKGRGTRTSSRLNAKDDGDDEGAAPPKSAQGRPTRNASKRNAGKFAMCSVFVLSGIKPQLVICKIGH